MPDINTPPKVQKVKRKWATKAIQFDAATWPEVKSIVALETSTIRDWLDGLIKAAIEKRKQKKEKSA